MFSSLKNTSKMTKAVLLIVDFLITLAVWIQIPLVVEAARAIAGGFPAIVNVLIVVMYIASFFFVGAVATGVVAVFFIVISSFIRLSR